jgi:hypothetical protein
MRVFALIACLVAVSDGAMAEDFSWGAHLGISGEKLQNELKAFSSCDSFKPLSFSFLTSTSPDFKISVGHWTNPIASNSGFFSADDERVAQSSKISELKCSADMGVQINALLFENVVFEIMLYYNHCKEIGCNKMAPSPIDKSLASKLPEKIIYGYTEQYFRAYSSMLSDLYLTNKLLDAGNCDFRISATYRCIIMAKADDGIWHAVTMTEVFESGIFSERILGRFASSQRFTLMEVDKRAWATFTSEVTSKVQAFIENRKQLNEEKNRIRELRESPLQSVR